MKLTHTLIFILFLFFFFLYYSISNEPYEFHSNPIIISETQSWESQIIEEIHPGNSFLFNLFSNATLKVDIVFQKVPDSNSTLLNRIFSPSDLVLYRNLIFEKTFTGLGQIIIKVELVIPENLSGSNLQIEWSYEKYNVHTFFTDYSSLIIFLMLIGLSMDTLPKYLKKFVRKSQGSKILEIDRQSTSAILLSIKYHLNYLPNSKSIFACSSFLLLVSNPRSAILPSFEKFSPKVEIIEISVLIMPMITRICIVMFILFSIVDVNFSNINFELTYPVSRKSHWIGKSTAFTIFALSYEFVYLLFIFIIRYSVFLDISFNYSFFLLFYVINVLLDLIIFNVGSSIFFMTKDRLVSFLSGTFMIYLIFNIDINARTLIYWLLKDSTNLDSISSYFTILTCLVLCLLFSFRTYSNMEVN